MIKNVGKAFLDVLVEKNQSWIRDRFASLYLQSITNNPTEIPEDFYFAYGAAAIEPLLIEEKQKYWTNFVKLEAEKLLFVELDHFLTLEKWQDINSLEDRVLAVKRVLEICKNEKEGWETLHYACLNLSERKDGITDDLKFLFKRLAEMFYENFIDAALRHENKALFRRRQEPRFKTIEEAQAFINKQREERAEEIAPRNEAEQLNDENVQ